MCTMAHIIDDDLLEDSLEYFEAVLTLNSTEQVTVIPERTRVQIFDNDREFMGTKPCAILFHIIGVAM